MAGSIKWCCRVSKGSLVLLHGESRCNQGHEDFETDGAEYFVLLYTGVY